MVAKNTKILMRSQSTPASQTGYLITWFINPRGKAGPEIAPLGFVAS